MKIDLSKEMSEPAMPVKADAQEGGKHYPCLYIDGGPELDKLPDEGVMKVRFKIKDRTKTTRNDETNHSLAIEALEILGVTGGSKKKDDRKEAESDLDKYAAEESKKPAANEDDY